MNLKRFVPVFCALFLCALALHRAQPPAQPETPPLTWAQFLAQCEREDAAYKAFAKQNDEPARRIENESDRLNFSEPKTAKKTTQKRSGIMADYLVSGAGDSSYNGTYTQSGTYNSKAAYTNGSRWIFWETMGGSRWAMNTSKSDMAIPYEGGSSGSTPTTGAWSIGPGGGTAPAPTVSEVVADSTPPTFASASVPANGNSIAVALTEADSAPILPASGVTGFTVLVNGTARSISSATASGTTVTLNLASAVYAGDVVTVSYAPGNVTDSASNAMASFGAQSVTNNSTVPAPPTVRRPMTLVNGRFQEMGNSEALPSTLLGNALVIGAGVKRTTNQAIPNNVDTLVLFDSEIFDSHAFHSTSTNTSRLTIPDGHGGLYLAVAQCCWANNTTGYRTMDILLNGALSFPAPSTYMGTIPINKATLNLTSMMVLAAGDYLEMKVGQNSGGSLDLTTTSSFQIVKLGIV
jgi:hypothetical protein